MNYKRFKYYIVVDGDNKPMAFDGNQFYYCNTERANSPFPLKYYTEKKARELIRKSNDWRVKKGFQIDEMRLMPIGNKNKSL